MAGVKLNAPDARGSRFNGLEQSMQSVHRNRRASNLRPCVKCVSIRTQASRRLGDIDIAFHSEGDTAGAKSSMPEQLKATLHIDNMKVNLDGRVYEAPHVIITGLAKANGSIESGNVKIDGEFNGLPQVNSIEDLVEISSEGNFESDLLGSGIVSISELEDGYVIEFNKLTVRFDVDESSDKVSVRIPKIGELKSAKLSIEIEGDVSFNLVLSPFITGAITVRGPSRLKIIAGEEVKITNESEARVGGTKEVQVQKAPR